MKKNFTQNSSDAERQQLRKQLLTRRGQLTSAERLAAEHAVERHLLALPELQRPCRVGSYYSVRAELPTQGINATLQSAGHRLALPVLHPVVPRHLLFLHTDAATHWHRNDYNIPEPALRCQDVVPLQQIAILLVPLVGFDAQGNRMGMGGGFYDRTLAGWRAGHFPNLQPIGLALDEQFVEQLPTASWDVPLPRVICPAKVWDFRR